MIGSRAAFFGTAALALTIAVAASVPVRAQDDLRAKGQSACSTDANKLCKSVLGQGDMIVLACFKEHKTRLSKRCREFLASVNQLED